MSNLPPSVSENDPNAPWNQIENPWCDDCECYMEEWDAETIKIGRTYQSFKIFKCPVCGETKSDAPDWENL